MTPSPESIKKRYSVTFLAQVVRWLLSFIVTAGIVPRRLGPVVYGNYNFLLSASATLRGFLDPSAQQAFLTFSSQERRTGSLTKLYSLAILGQIVIVFLLICAAAIFNKLHLFFPDQKLHQILAITALDWFLFLAMSLQQLGDCKGLTVFPQILSAGIAVVNAIILLALAFVHKLNLFTYVWVSLVSATIWVMALAYWLLVVHSDLCWAGNLSDEIRTQLRRWWRFASPLLFLDFYGPITAFLSTYMIQVWYGSSEQGNYNLALRWCSPALAFTSAALMIFWREIAHLTTNGQWQRAQQIYIRFQRLLFFLSMALALWICFCGPTLITLLAGQQFKPAIPILMIMAFYPVIQTSGHLTGASFKATERTLLFRNLSFLLSVPDVILTYFLLAKSNAILPGMHLGAMGLAIKMVPIGFLLTEVYMWVDFRYFGLSYGRWLFHRVCLMLALGGGATLTLKLLNEKLQMLGLNPIASLLVASVPYGAAMLSLIWIRPGVVGMTRPEISEYMYKIIQKMTTFSLNRSVT